MSWEDVLAAITGGLGGGLDGLQFMRKTQRDQKRQKDLDDRQAEVDRRAAETHAATMENQRLLREDRERGAVKELLDTLGRGAVVDEPLRGRATAAGFGSRLAPEETLSSSMFSGYTGGDLASGETTLTPSPGRETGRFRVAPTAAEMRADQAAETKRRADAAAQKALTDAITGLPDHLRPVASFGAASGKMPTMGAADFVSPEQRTAQEIAQAVEREKALVPIRLRQREGEKAIDQRYANTPAPIRDDPSLPRGVRSYLGDLVAKYQNDPTGARAELQRASPDLLRDHPNLDLVKVTQQINAMLPLPKEPADGTPVDGRTPGKGRAGGVVMPLEPAPGPAPGTTVKAAPPIPLAGQPPRAAAQPSQPQYQPGQRVRTKSGQVVTIARINPDGSYEVR